MCVDICTATHDGDASSAKKSVTDYCVECTAALLQIRRRIVKKLHCESELHQGEAPCKAEEA